MNALMLSNIIEGDPSIDTRGALGIHRYILRVEPK